MTTAWQQKCTGNSPCPKGYGLFFAQAQAASDRGTVCEANAKASLRLAAGGRPI